MPASACRRIACWSRTRRRRRCSTRNVGTGWELRNSLSVQRTSDKYFVTEGVYGSPDENLVYREPLDFHHIRRPVQNQTEVVGRVGGFGTHNLLLGYEYHRDKYRTEVTAGDDPGLPVRLLVADDRADGHHHDARDAGAARHRRPSSERRSSTIGRRRFYVQDQIDIAPQVKVNLGYRLDDYKRAIDRVGGLPVHAAAPGADGALVPRGHRLRAALRPADLLRDGDVVHAGEYRSRRTDRSSSRARRATTRSGHRWQGWNGRVDTTAAVYYIVRNNVTVQQSVISFIQVGEQNSKGLDVDVNTDLGGETSSSSTTAWRRREFEDAGRPGRQDAALRAEAQREPVAAQGLGRAASTPRFGLRYLAEQFGDNANTQLPGRLHDLFRRGRVSHARGGSGR